MGIVVAIVALNVGVVSDTGYTVLVLVAIGTSIAAPQLLHSVVRGSEIPAEEAARLDQEALRSTSEILGSHRILLPTRGGANSRDAALILASAFDNPDVTVLAVDIPARRSVFGHRRAGSHADPREVDLGLGSIRHNVVRMQSRDPAAAIAREASLGYGLMLVGASADDRETARLFSTVVDRILALVDIPTVVMRLPAGFVITERPSRVLLPVVASRSSRAAEELAFAVIQETGGSVLAVHVVNRPEDQGIMFDSVTEVRTLEAGHAVTAEALAFGERLGVAVEGAVHVASNAEAEIVTLANGGGLDLLVVGHPTVHSQTAPSSAIGSTTSSNTPRSPSRSSRYQGEREHPLNPAWSYRVKRSNGTLPTRREHQTHLSCKYSQSSSDGVEK